MHRRLPVALKDRSAGPPTRWSGYWPRQLSVKNPAIFAKSHKLCGAEIGSQTKCVTGMVAVCG